MPGEVWNQSGEDWQNLIVQLLQIRYSAIGEFVQVPDTVNGDCGIEGFSRDGRAYQCYAAQEPLETSELTKKQKAKITDSFGKLVKYRTELEGILNPTEISHWILVVPRWEDKDLLRHAHKKAEDLKLKDLPFISSEFVFSIATSNDFILERQKLYTTRSEQLEVVSQTPDGATIQDWVDENNELVNDLERKAQKVCGGDSNRARDLRDEYIRHFIIGSNLLDFLRSDYPQIYEAAYRAKQAKVKVLRTQSLIAATLPRQLLKEVTDNYLDELESLLPSVIKSNVEDLVYHAVAEWLINCPLNFPD